MRMYGKLKLWEIRNSEEMRRLGFVIMGYVWGTEVIGVWDLLDFYWLRF